MKVIIAGSRGITEFAEVMRAIRASGYANEISEVVCGKAVGVDSIGERWAISNGIPVKEMPANWSLHGKAAGPIRNREMAKYADAAIVIWDGKSRGALNMIQTMKKLGKPVYVDVINDENTSGEVE